MQTRANPQKLWRHIGTGAAILALLLLIPEHLIPHGPNFEAVDHWLSEYVLSAVPAAVWLMKCAFLALAASALSVAVLSKEGIAKLLFGVSALGLGSMAGFDTDPNDKIPHPFQWPLTHGNIHQLLLSVAIGATLSGIAVRLFVFDSKQEERRKFEVTLFWIAVVATIVQVALVIYRPTETRFGGIAERIIVLAALLWVISFCARQKPNRSTSDTGDSP